MVRLLFEISFLKFPELRVYGAEISWLELAQISVQLILLSPPVPLTETLQESFKCTVALGIFFIELNEYFCSAIGNISIVATCDTYERPATALVTGKVS